MKEMVLTGLRLQALQAAVERLHKYVATLEVNVENLEKKR